MAWRGSTTIRFNGGVTVISGTNYDKPESDSNGSGKSSILYAICWCIWGKLPVKFSINDLIHTGQEGCWVEVTLRRGDTDLKISRSREGRNTVLSFKLGGNTEVDGDVNAVQRELEDVLQITWEEFQATTFLSPHNTKYSFYYCTPAKRVALLSPLVNDELFQHRSKNIQEDLKKLTRQFEKITSQSLAYQGVIHRETERQQMLAEQLNQARLVQDKQRSESDIVIGEIEKTLFQLRQREKEINRLIEEENNVRAALGAVNSIVRNIEQQQHSVASDIRHLTTSHAAGAVCPTCQQRVTTEHINQLSARRQQAIAKMTSFNAELAIHTPRKLELEKQLASFDAMRNERNSIYKQMEVLKERRYGAKVGIQTQEVAVLQSQIDSCKTTIQEYIRLQADRDQQAAMVASKAELLKPIYQGFSSGIRQMLTSELREMFEYYTHTFTSYLLYDEFDIAYPESDSDSFLVELHRRGESAKLPSTGEVHRAALAVTLALRQVVLARRGSCVLDMMLIDDPVGSIDGEGCQALSRLLEAMSDNVSTILITIPRPGVVGQHSLEVFKRNEVSRLGNT